MRRGSSDGSSDGAARWNQMMEPNSLAKTLRAARKATGETMEMLAPKVGVTKNTLAAYERGERLPEIDFLAVFADRTGADFSELFWLRLANSEAAEARFITDPAVGTGNYLVSLMSDRQQARQLDATAEMGEFVLLPRYDVRGSAGGGAVVQSEQVVDYLAFKREWVVERLRRNPNDLVLVEATGDSMQPRINHGDLLLIDTAVERVRDHAIYALNFSGQLVIKYVARRFSGTVKIFSENERYPADELTAEEAEQLRIVGQVIWSGGLL